jgi:hypothetical protein
MAKGPRRRRPSTSRFHKAAMRSAGAEAGRSVVSPVTVRRASAAELAEFDASRRTVGQPGGHPDVEPDSRTDTEHLRWPPGWPSTRSDDGLSGR